MHYWNQYDKSEEKLNGCYNWNIESFVKGLEDAGYSYEISDLHAENFCPVMSEDEYVREGFYQMDRPVKEDVLRDIVLQKN